MSHPSTLMPHDDARQQVRNILAASPLTTIFFDRDGHFLSANNAWEQNWATDPAEWHDYNILTDPQITEAGLSPFLERGFAGEGVELSPLYYDPALGGRAGRGRWIQMFIHPLRDSEGKVAEIAVVQQDVSIYKQTEDVLRFLTGVSTALTFSLDYQTVLERVTKLAVPYLADWCFVDLVEESGTFRRTAVAHVHSNQAPTARELERRYDLATEERHGTAMVLGSRASELVPECAAETPAEGLHYRSSLRQLGAQSYICVPLEVHGRMLGAMTFVMAESARRYGPADLALAEELARRAAMAVDNARLYREAQEANRAKDEFLMVAAHELRTPLTTLVGYAHMLLSNRITESTQQDALARVEQDAWSLVQIVNDIVDVSRVIAGRIQLDPRPLDVSAVIDAAVSAVRPAAEAKNITLRIGREQHTGIVAGDGQRIQQIVWHLLNNAVKFTPAGGHVELTISSTETHAIITVVDDGIGISPDFLPFVFERFRQHDGPLTRSHSGLGLGLSIVKYLTELHGGRVHATSRGEGQGATFSVELPLIAALSWEANERLKYGETRHDPALLHKLRVLAVDTDEATRELIADGLRGYGADVRASASSTEALHLLTEWDPDVLVSDMSMPGIDGYALIRKVRASQDSNSAIAAVAITDHMRTTDRLRTLSAGYQAHFAKPVKAEELAFAIANLTGRTVRATETPAASENSDLTSP